jgi:nucleotide-binding universal stress UspA family protein
VAISLRGQKSARIGKEAASAPVVPVTSSTPAPAQTKHVIAVLRGNSMDKDVVKMACMFARPKGAKVLALYGIEVPRRNTLEDPMPAEEAHAAKVLESATAMAEHYELASDDIETDLLKTRNFALSVVEEVRCSCCTLLILGAGFAEKHDGAVPLDEETNYILEHATCRVMLLRANQENC